MDFVKYKRDFKKKSTKYHLENYYKYNEEFRKYAREEFEKRKVPEDMLPYKKRKKQHEKSESVGYERKEHHHDPLNMQEYIERNWR